MLEPSEVVKQIALKYTQSEETERQRVSMLNSPMAPALKDDLDRTYKKHLAMLKDEIDGCVSALVRWPPHKIEHFAKLKQFWATTPYERAVFIMTKYPDGSTALDKKLQEVIDVVKAEIVARGYSPLLANDTRYHPELFKNVELYLLGCSKAVALVESKHTAELNPNVTMEWGWLRSTDRDVLFLVEKDFDLARADIAGLIQDRFDWSDPSPGIKAAMAGFLK